MVGDTNLAALKPRSVFAFDCPSFLLSPLSPCFVVLNCSLFDLYILTLYQWALADQLARVVCGPLAEASLPPGSTTSDAELHLETSLSP
jgi:hypothetical protein